MADLGRNSRQAASVPKRAMKVGRSDGRSIDGMKWGDQPEKSFDEAVARYIADHLPRVKASSRRR